MIFNFDSFFASGQWGNILRFRDGGLAVYGGIIASAFGFIIYSRAKKIPIGNLLDAAGFGLFVGQAIGRWGNFINREAFGVETNLPWRMGLTARGNTTYVHPAFIYESIWNVAGLFIIHTFSKKSKTKYPGQYFLFYVGWYGLGRFMIEGLRTDSLFIPGSDIRASQLLAILSCITAIVILFVNFLRGKEVTHRNNIEDDNMEPVFGEDAEDAEDAEAADELAKLDGASADEIESESDESNEDNESAENNENDEIILNDENNENDSDNVILSEVKDINAEE
jgi:phosphatidylglycerol:prolipoprotein diacylglycerol transferase